MGACRLKSKPYLQPCFPLPLSSLSSRKSPSSFIVATVHSLSPARFSSSSLLTATHHHLSRQQLLTATHHHRSRQSTLLHPLISLHEKSPSSFTANNNISPFLWALSANIEFETN